MSLHFDLSAVFFMITRILYIFGKNVTEMTLYPPPPKKYLKQKFHETIFAVWETVTFSVIILNAGFTTTLLHSPLMGQKTVPKASRCLRPSLPSLWLSLDLLLFFCLSGTMLTVFSFLLWDQLFQVSFGLYVLLSSACSYHTTLISSVS